MPPAISGNGEHFEVHCSGVVAQQIYELQDSATGKQKKEIADAFWAVVKRLQVDPHDFGEPLYRLPSMRMQVRTSVVPPLAVIFAVCEDRPHVFIKRVKLIGKRG